jgi:regulator of RNase E activity RraB
MSSIRIKEFEVPTGVIVEVADIITSKNLENRITGIDEDQTLVFIEVRYDKNESDQKNAIHEIYDAINEYDDEDNDEDK